MALAITGQAQGLVLPIAQKSGQPGGISVGWNNELNVSEILPRYASLALTGNVYSVQYAAAATAAASASSTGSFGLYNPAGSGKNLVLLDSTVVLTVLPAASATTFQVGMIAVAQFPTTTTAGNTPVNMLVGSQLQAVAKTFTAGTLSGAPTVSSRQMFALYQDAAAVTSTATPVIYRDQIDGAVIIAPGSGIDLVSVSGTPTVAWSLTWTELPA